MRHTVLISVVLLLAVLLAFTSAETYYVTPTASTPCPEEDMPCFTLSQYATKPNDYFAFNTTLILLAGNHSLHSECQIRNITNLAIIQNRTTAHSENDMSITCTSQSARFTMNGIGVVIMRGLVLIGCMNNNITSVEQFILEDCSLQGQGQNGTGLELNWITSSKIVRSSFSSYTGVETLDSDWGPVRAQVGGAVIIRSSTVSISSSIFTNNNVSRESVWMSGGAMYAESSNIMVHNTTFNNNTVTGAVGTFGGAVHAWSSNITIHSTIFNNNTATGGLAFGGAMYTWLSYITIHNSTFNNNTGTGGYAKGGAIYAIRNNITVHTTTFESNTVTGDSGSGGAVYAESSNITIHNTTFNNNCNTATGEDDALGGAVYAKSSNLNIHNTILNNNTLTATGESNIYGGGGASGGAVYACCNNITIHTTTFNNNTVTGVNVAHGGAVYACCNVTINTTSFNNNTVTGEDAKGGAVFVYNAITYNTTFNNNIATGVYGRGGALYVFGYHNIQKYRFEITIHNTTFNNNTVTGKEDALGGAIYAEASNNIIIYNTTFSNNTAHATGDNGQGGAMYLNTVTRNSAKFLIIQNNMADIGGALYAIQSTMYFSGNTTISNNYGSFYVYGCNVTFGGHTNIMNNSYFTNTSQEGGAVTAIQSELVFTGTANLSYNTAIRGGAISATQSKLYVYGDITIAHNTASISGGGIYAYQSEINLENHINISNNSAVERGGGIHVISSITRMTDHSKTYFVGNHAKRGGGACLEMNAKFYIVKKDIESENTDKWIRLEFTENSADYGGALYITDDTNSGTCHATPFSGESTISSECFIQGCY